MVEQWPVLTLLPPVVAIILAIWTRKVLLSLGMGVVLAALLVSNFGPVGFLRQLWAAFAGIFWAEGAVNTGSVFILLFLLILGMITALVLMAGGSEAFSDWAAQKITSRRGAKSLAAGLGTTWRRSSPTTCADASWARRLGQASVRGEGPRLIGEGIGELEPMREQLQWCGEVVETPTAHRGVERVVDDRKPQSQEVQTDLVRLPGVGDRLVQAPITI